VIALVRTLETLSSGLDSTERSAMPETVLFSLLSACPLNQNRSGSKAILGPIYKTFTLNKMGMELTQSSIIKHPVVHHTACIGNIIEQVAFVPESQRSAWNRSFPISRSDRTFQNPQAITFRSNLIRDQAKKPRTELRSTEARKARVASANLHDRIESPARIVHIILWRICLLASAGWSLAEMRRIGRTDEEERFLASSSRSPLESPPLAV
jgi:hypothetical protein